MHSATFLKPGRDLCATAATDFASWIKENSTVLIPVGALEQHGSHMPLGTDALLATAVARSVADQLAQNDFYPAKVSQTFSYGYKSQQKSGGGNHLPGTISLDANTLINYTRSITRAFLEQGAKQVVFINGHYENYQFLYEGVDLALRDLKLECGASQYVLLLSYWDYVSEQTLQAVYPAGFPGWDIEHGGVLETSLMLHLHPELTNLDQAISHAPAQLTKFDRLPVVPERTPATGCLSAPDGSSKEKGELMFNQVVESIAADLRQELAAL